MVRSIRRVSRWARYAIAVMVAATAVLLRMAVDAWIGSGLPYSIVFLFVILSARWLGSGPAMLVLALGSIGSVLVRGGIETPRLVLTAIASLTVIWMIEVLRRAHARAEESASLAEDRLQHLQRETERHAAEARMAAHLKAVVDSSGDAIISKDLEGIILSWNFGAEQIFGYVASEAVGQKIAILLPEDRTHEESDIVERIRHGGRISHFETVRRRKDGVLIDVSLTISPIRDSDGKIVGASHIARDITERRQLEEQLRQTQKLESLGVLAGGLAHDFNNLLTGIMGNASLAIYDLDSESPAHARMQEIVQASERAALLIRQMLAYAGKGQFLIEQLDVSAQVKEIMPLVRSSIPPIVTLDLHLDPALPPVAGDRSQMQQLIMNLVINGAEAIGDRPGVVTLRTSSRETDSERQVVLEVRDTGCGMDAPTRQRIFDPFFTTKFTGRGLGLSAVLGIIRTHRGTISVDSTPGAGTVFTVVLPASDPRPAVPSGEAQTELRGYGNILVVDDEELVRNMARFTLERCGYSIEIATDGRSALDVFSRHPQDFAAVLLDLTMPVMSGEETLRRLREIRPDVPVVLSSGFSETEALERFRNQCLAGFLQKPYTATALARKVKQAVKRPNGGK